MRDHLYRSESATVIALSALAWVSALGCTISPRATDTVTHDGSRDVRFLGLTPTSPESPTAPQIQALLPGETWHTLARTGVLPTEPILLGSLTLYPYTGSAEVPDAFWQRRLFNRYEARVRVIEEGGSLGHFVGGAGETRNESVVSAPEMFLNLQNKRSALNLETWGVSSDSFTIGGGGLAAASCNICGEEPGASGVLCQDPPSCVDGRLLCPCTPEEFVDFASEAGRALERYLTTRPVLDPAINPDSGSAIAVMDIEKPSEIVPKNWHLLSDSDPDLFD